jgi:hypothetical protein
MSPTSRSGLSIAAKWPRALDDRVPGAALPPLLLDDDEAVAVAVGLRNAANGAVAGIEATSVRALAKIERDPACLARLRRCRGRGRALHLALGDRS